MTPAEQLRGATAPAALAELQRRWVQPGWVATCCLPGLAHRQAHHGPLLAARELVGLHDAVRTLSAERGSVRLEGELVHWHLQEPQELTLELLTLLASARAHLPVAAVLSAGEVLVQGELWLGAPLHANRTLAAYARAGELLITDEVRRSWPVIPEGLGVFLAPQALSDAVGTPVHIVRDYRE